MEKIWLYELAERIKANFEHPDENDPYRPEIEMEVKFDKIWARRNEYVTKNNIKIKVEEDQADYEPTGLETKNIMGNLLEKQIEEDEPRNVEITPKYLREFRRALGKAEGIRNSDQYGRLEKSLDQLIKEYEKPKKNLTNLFAHIDDVNEKIESYFLHTKGMKRRERWNEIKKYLLQYEEDESIIDIRDYLREELKNDRAKRETWTA